MPDLAFSRRVLLELAYAGLDYREGAAMEGLNQASGVDYDALDPAKILGQRYARRTDGNLETRFPGKMPLIASRGESAFLLLYGDHYLGYVIEGLGTKNRAADAFQAECPEEGSRYEGIGYDGVASMVNDLITLGVLPMVAAMYAAVGDGVWFKDRPRAEALMRGWKLACDDAGCIWAGGETPALEDIVYPDALDLAGFASGRTLGLDPWLPERIKEGDAIIFLESSGIHMNGLTSARKLAKTLRDGYRTRVPGTDRTLGETLLERAHIYVRAVELMLRQCIGVRYAAHITGHGWRKLMRAPQPLTYVIHTLPTERPIFQFLRWALKYDELRMYSTYNMGAGFALIVDPADVVKLNRAVLDAGLPYRAYVAGRVERGPKRVVIEPLRGLTLRGNSMNIR